MDASGWQRRHAALCAAAEGLLEALRIYERARSALLVDAWADAGAMVRLASGMEDAWLRVGLATRDVATAIGHAEEVHDHDRGTASRA